MQLGNGDEAICDWWGTARNLVRRSPERVAIVFGFSRNEEEQAREDAAKMKHAATDSVGRW